MGDRSPRGGRFRRLDLAMLSAGLLLAAAGAIDTNPVLISVAGGLFLLGSSTFVVIRGLETFTGEAIREDEEIDQDTGWLIGKLENVLVFVLVIFGEWTALSIVFAAKSFVRREDISSGNTTYYLAGTLLNFTYSVVVALLVVGMLSR